MATAAPSSALAVNGTDTISYWYSPLYLNYVYNKDVSTTCLLCLSLVGGLAVVFAILRRRRARLTNFDVLVLTLTFWQLVYDFSFLFLMQIVPDKFGRSNSYLFVILCGPDCRDRTEAGVDDDEGPTHILSPYLITWDVFFFLKKWSEIGAGLCSNLLTITVTWIVCFTRIPSWQLKHFKCIMLTIALISVVVPLVQLMYFTDRVSEFPYRGERTDDAGSPSMRKTSMDSKSFQSRLHKTLTTFQVLIVVFNFIGSSAVLIVVHRSRVKAQSQGRRGESPMIEVAKRLAIYPFVQLVTKLPELRYYLECYEKTDTIEGYSKTAEFHLCESAHFIVPSTTGFFFALIWFYFQPLYGKQLRAAIRRVSAFISNMLAPAKSSRPVSQQVVALGDLADDELMDIISGDQGETRRVPAPKLEMAQDVVGTVDNPMSQPWLVATARSMVLAKDEGESRDGVEERPV